MSEEYWQFMEGEPPYRTCRPDEPEGNATGPAEPSLEGAELLARKGQVMAAIRVYREATGASLAEAKKAVDSWSDEGPRQEPETGQSR